MNKELLFIALVAIASNSLIYAPFVLGLNDFAGVSLRDTGIDVLQRYWDGPLYVVVANYFYDVNADYSFYSLEPGYYAAHLPLYPLLIRSLSFVGYFNALLLATTLSFIAALYAFYFFVKKYFNENAFWVTIAFAFIPFRWVVYHSIGATEPLFIACFLASFYFYKKNNLLLAGVFGALAALTRIQGVLLFPALAIDYFVIQKKKFSFDSIVKISLIPASLAVLFVFYYFNFGDFFAYFKVNAGFLQGFLSSIINYGGPQPGDEYLLVFFLSFLTIGLLIDKKFYAEAVFSSLLMLQVLFLSHNDIARYLIPVLVFGVMFLQRLTEKKWFKLALPFIALGGVIYAMTVLPLNVMDSASFTKLFTLLN
ncbi:hypothetical protein HUU53_03850 [Candidatus Micrarchaeota archaeon]|nr:hypothetical protein [Candidatus Micrarchaeota archaeon]